MLATVSDVPSRIRAELDDIESMHFCKAFKLVVSSDSGKVSLNEFVKSGTLEVALALSSDLDDSDFLRVKRKGDRASLLARLMRRVIRPGPPDETGITDRTEVSPEERFGVDGASFNSPRFKTAPSLSSGSNSPLTSLKTGKFLRSDADESKLAVRETPCSRSEKELERLLENESPPARRFRAARYPLSSAPGTAETIRNAWYVERNAG